MGRWLALPGNIHPSLWAKGMLRDPPSAVILLDIPRSKGWCVSSSYQAQSAVEETSQWWQQGILGCLSTMEWALLRLRVNQRSRYLSSWFSACSPVLLSESWGHGKSMCYDNLWSKAGDAGNFHAKTLQQSSRLEFTLTHIKPAFKHFTDLQVTVLYSQAQESMKYTVRFFFI